MIRSGADGVKTALLVGGAVIVAAMVVIMSMPRFATLATDQRVAHAVALIFGAMTVVLALAASASALDHIGTPLWGLSWAAGTWLALDVAIGDAAATFVAGVFLATCAPALILHRQS